MKEMIDKLTQSIKDSCNEVVGQTQSIVDQTKYRTEVVSLKNEVKKLYQKLGKQYYTEYMEKESEKEESPVCNRITVLLKEIQRLEDKIEETTKTQKDSFTAYKRAFKNTWEEETVFTETKTDENGIKILKFCKQCNIGNNVDAQFCVNCGKKF